jgi:hypothetical protein
VWLPAWARLRGSVSLPFESLNDFMAAVTLNLAALQAEKNYTDLEPTFQVSEVPICR